MKEFKDDAYALTDPPVYCNWRTYSEIFDNGTMLKDDFADHHLTNYQHVILRLVNTWDSNKASAHANSDLIKALRKKIKKAKRALK